MTFGVEEGFEKDKAQNELFYMDEENELEKLEKLMEEEIKRTKTRASLLMFFEVFAFTTQKSQVNEESEETMVSSYDEEVSKQEIA